MFIKTFIKDFFSFIGYEVQRKSNVGFNERYLSKVLIPETIIDVGVGRGTWPLYKAFPSAHFVLIEPLQDYFKPYIEAISSKYDCEVYYTAVGEKKGDAYIEVNNEAWHKSTMAYDSEFSLSSKNKYFREKVPVTTLDLISMKNELKEPVLLKLDAEGHELSILKGADKLLKHTKAIICEVSIQRESGNNGYQIEDILMFLRERGFYLYSFLRIHHLNHETRPRIADILFMKDI